MESTTRFILFDLDNTLLDHDHSLKSAITAVREEYVTLAVHPLAELIDKYNYALQRAYDKYLSKEITFEETHPMKVNLFFTELGLPKPSEEEVVKFRAIYKPAYRKNWRATPGAIETLVRLRENGYRIGIVTNGQIEDQTAKIKFIGISHLVDRIITSQEVGFAKPDRRVFQTALDAFGASPSTTYMVGDSVDSDIKGALNSGLIPILYSPNAKESQLLLSGEKVSVITHMDQLLEKLGIDSLQIRYGK